MSIKALSQLCILPLNKGVMDVQTLQLADPALFASFCEALWQQQPWSAGLDWETKTGPQDRRRQALQQLQRYALHWHERKQKLSLGYPLFVLEDEKLGRSLSAPLWYWPLELQHKGQGHWDLRYKGQQPILNEVLKNYLEDRYNFDWEELLGDTAPRPAQAIEDWLWPLCKLLGWDLPPLAFRLPLPWEPLKALAPGIHAHGFWGNFQLPGQVQANTLGQLQARWRHQLAYTDLQPEQDSVAAALFRGESFRLRGASGSGKTYTLSALLPSLFSDKANILVVSAKVASFNDWTYHLEQHGLAGLPYLSLQEEQRDKERLAQALVQTWPEAPSLDKQAYSHAFNQYEQLAAPLRQAHAALRQDLQAGSYWTEEVGQFLHAQALTGKYWLMPLLSVKSFEWTMAEYRQLLDQVALQMEYNQALLVPAAHSPLRLLRDSWFGEYTLGYAQEAWVAPLREQIAQFMDFSRRYALFIDEYHNERWALFQEHGREISRGLQRVLDRLWLDQNLYGEELYESQGFWAKAKALFSSRAQQIRQALDDLKAAYQPLVHRVEDKGLLAQPLPAFPAANKLQAWQTELFDYLSYLNKWQQNIPQLIQQQMENLNLSFPMKPELKEKLHALEQEWKDWLEAWQKARYADDPEIQNKAQGLLEREAGFRRIAGRLLRLDRALVQELAPYHRWRNHWLGSSPLLQELVEALRQTGVEDWISAFRSWYLFNYLLKHYHAGMPQDELPLESYRFARQQLQQHLSLNAQSRLAQRRQEAAELPKPGSLQGQSLSVWLKEQGLERLLPYFPLVFAQPERLEVLLPGRMQPVFDLLIIEDAHLLSAKQQRRLSRLAKQFVLVEHPPQDEAEADLTGDYASRLLQALPLYSLEGRHSKDAKSAPAAAWLYKGKRQPAYTQAWLDYLAYILSQHLGEARISRPKDPDFPAHLVILPQEDKGLSIAIRAEGGLADYAELNPGLLWRQAQHLSQEGYVLRDEWSVHWWRHPDKALQNLLAFIAKQDERGGNAALRY